MIKNPLYGDDIIVLIRYDNEYFWYLSEKTIWVMNYTKWMEIFYPFSNKKATIPEREGLDILNRDNWLEFKERNVELATNREELRRLIEFNLPITSWDEKGELFPALFLDFDKNILYSLFPESLAFERYVPEYWTGLYEDFYSLIPDAEKYWIIEGVDHFPKE
ncbi:hypothetical protein GO495_31425 [Chitinophaga oryziterrae]|uniref:Group-specific protein n=1 Tax=Chitinophaga oryziterrae TaxID=1031224 RepID=A0A6N8JL54_9BACT|nr:hypothetical protein [Chitinophaga oryziterrae]MVT45141.1 hypothetical protein [Chitinophaga oryziterrae]